MLGVCFAGVTKVEVTDVDDPRIESGRDAIVRVQLAGLCGSDLHPYFGREVGIEDGTVMGHEFVGTIEEVGPEIRNFRVGDRVCAPFTTNCGDCFYCKEGLTSRCTKGQLFGWREQGNGLHGGQSQWVRVPLADTTLMRVPEEIDNPTALLVGDNLSTAFFANDLAEVNHRGSFAVIGCGTVGLLAIAVAKSRGVENLFSVDPNEFRCQIARRLGAQAFTSSEEAIEEIRSATSGRGVDGVMELVGLPAAQATAYEAIRPGGSMGVIGCHCTPNFSFRPSDAYDKNLTYRTGRCPARHYMTNLSKSPLKLDLSWCITHQFPIDQGVEAYDTFANGRDQVIKAAIEF